MKDTLFEMQNNWESYVKFCSSVNNKGKTVYTYSKNHDFYDLLINKLTSEFKGLVNSKSYKVDASLGEGGLAVIPWLAIMNRGITESVQNRFYVVYLFSRNCKKVLEISKKISKIPEISRFFLKFQEISGNFKKFIL